MKLNGNRLFYAMLVVLAIGLAFGVRTYICNRELDRVRELSGGVDFPQFMGESAIMYGYASQVARGESIAGSDKNLAKMEDVPLAAQMFLGLEYFLGWGYRLKNAIFGSPATDMNTTYEDNPDFSRWVMYQIRLWISLVAGMIFLLLLILRVPWYLAFSGAALYAVSPAAIARYTGQDLLRGEFCMPFIVLAVLMFFWTHHQPRPYKFILLGLAVFCSFAFWDAPQMFFTAWCGIELLRILAGGGVNQKRRHLWLVAYIAMALAAVLVPYHRYHMLLASPLVMVVMPLMLIMMFLVYPRNLVAKWRYAIVIFFGLFLLWRTVSVYGENYGHFMSLMAAKLRFMNVKPSDPALLDFDARILWTPVMHSANWPMTKAFYPFALPFATALGAFMMLTRRMRRTFCYHLPLIYPFLMFTIGFFVLYVLIVRAHVFCAVFLCILLPVLLDCLRRTWKGGRGGMTATVIVILLALSAVLYEGATSYKLKRDYSEGYFKETAALIKWFRSEDVGGVTVLADMEVSPVLKAYCGMKIINQPQFELKIVRDTVEEYLMTMFNGTLKDMTDFCDRHQVQLLVFDRGRSDFQLPMHIYSNRYMAAAEKLKRNAPAWLLAKKPGQLKNFHLINPPRDLAYINNSYFVFKYVSDAAREQALKSATLSEYFLKSGKPDLARKLALAAYVQAPNLKQTYIAWFNAFGTVPGDCLKYLNDKKRPKE
ncbi:MAG: hypothetical protein JXR78_04905 [Victivallales bacterium]|nr:hypothetical protein [Victivallales bacterium]